MVDINTLWIINSSGLCLLQHSYNGDQAFINETMFSGFVSAIINFSNRIFEDNLEKISMDKMDVYCHPFSDGKFYVVLAVNRGSNEKYIHQKIHEIGDAFQIEFKDMLDNLTINIADYDPFVDTLDKIVGVETQRTIPEQEEFLRLLKNAEEQQYTEYRTIEEILIFFEQLTPKKRQVVLQSALPIIEMFMESKNLKVEQMKRFQQILSI
ncbi:MAG: hypothetical protein EU542_05340 [Promethearchaeota archaeon]|nr:MAG: hypothetical protein EU542_05340 [Candidatus Lokiarchaeota archaeon]